MMQAPAARDEVDRPRRAKLSNLISEDLLNWIAREGLKPGDRLPNEKTLMQHYRCAKGTIREALKVLEVQGLVEMQTGPNGGAVIRPVSIDAVTQQLRTYLHFQSLDFEEVYAIRHSLEVTLAESVVGKLDETQLTRLEENIESCVAALAAGERTKARHLELTFHDLLCESCPNPLLVFICHFVNGLLRDLVEFRSNSHDEHAAFAQANLESHRRLLDAFRANDRAAVSGIMAKHMCEAENFMTRLDAAVHSDMLSR
ncbi:FadR/GntR family transcriptional regulator [Paracoccus suum]|nr:FCD domain-containing protein [Paracoccus suum]